MACVGLCAGLLAAILNSPALGPLAGWDAAALVYLVWVWRTIWPATAEQTARLAVRADPNRAWRDALLLAACVASLVGVGLVLATAGSIRGRSEQLHVGLGIGSVLISWMVVHTVFTTRYARLYYTGVDGGIDFNQPESPRYSDFAYVALTVGTTFQISDTNLTSNEMRVTALFHGLLSYLFGAVIIAVTVNLLAGLSP
nr:DUF1345 domain-containing protein [Micromonospora sp. DSM 115978]